MAQKVNITQTRSGNRCPQYQRKTLEALGLGKIGRTRTHEWTKTIQGMVTTVTHLVEVRESK